MSKKAKKKLAKQRKYEAWQETVRKSKSRGKLIVSETRFEKDKSRPRVGWSSDSLGRGMPGNEEEDP